MVFFFVPLSFEFFNKDFVSCEIPVSFKNELISCHYVHLQSTLSCYLAFYREGRKFCFLTILCIEVPSRVSSVS